MKIKNALYEEREISLNEYREEMKGYLHCPCCGVSIICVARYIRQSRDREIEVSPYFRVSKNPHLNTCKYLLKNRINEIYKNIKEQEENCDFIEKQDENCFSFHLRIITDENFPAKKNSSITYGNNKITDEFNKNQQKAFLKTVKAIISLKDSIEADEENDLRKMFHLAFYNKITKANETISWRNFYFDDDIEAYNNMYSYIKNTNPYHPMCVIGTIKKIETKGSCSYINLKSHKKSNNELIAINFSTKNEDVIIKLKEEQKIAVYAQNFKAYKNETKIDKYGNFYYNINAWVNVPEQLVIIN